MFFVLNLAVTSPQRNGSIIGSPLIVRGSAIETFENDNGDVISSHPVDLVISVSGSSAVTRNGVMGNWSASFGVSPGSKTVTVMASTAHGRTASDTRNVDVRDAGAPSLTVNEPAQGQLIEGPGPTHEVRIAGRATDQSPIASVQARVGNGPFQEVDKDSGTASNWNWSKTLAGLPDGTHVLQVKATDVHGNESALVSRTITIFRDSGPPEVNITSPPNTPTITWREGGVSVDVAGTAVDQVTSVKSVSWRLDGGPLNPATFTGTNWNFTATIPSPGLHEIGVVASDIRDNEGFDVVNVDVAVPFELDDIGYAPYLTDLMSFTRRRLRQTNAVGPASPVEREVLREAFHQHYDRVALQDYSAVATQPVAQVRIAVEVLRRYLSNSAEFPGYLERVYQLLLANFGTSYAEVRLTRTASSETRQRLADRLGITVTGLDQLFIAPDALSEAELQRVFGLADTTQDPLALTVGQAQLLTLRLSGLRAKWTKQDQQELASADDEDTPLPAIDPDLITERDLKSSLPGNAARDLYDARTQWVIEQLQTLRLARESEATPLAGFDRVTSLVSGATDIAGLLQQYQDGVDIEPTLRQTSLAVDAFFVLVGIRKLAESGVVTDDEWADVYNILVQVQKHLVYSAWIAEELDTGLIIEPGSFVPDQPRPQLVPWRSSWRSRRRWENKLQARVNQREALVQAQSSAIEATEAVALPLLRDELIATIDRQGFPVDDLADWLTERLSISFKYSGDQRLSRLEQAVETLRDLLIASRSGRLGSLTRLPIGTELPEFSLVEEGYSENEFDEEWQWMGSFATWRGAMFAFGYPENYLLPTLRDRSDWTAAFTELVRAVRQVGRLNASNAEALADKYVDTLNRPTDAEERPGDGFDLSINLTSELTIDELHARQIQSFDELDGNEIEGGGYPPRLEEAFFFVPMFLASSLQKHGEYQAALDWYQTVYAYELPVDERKIYHGLKAEEETRTEFRRSPDTWLLDGLDVFDIAHDRANALTRFTLMSIARCYLAFADAEFTRESNESIPYARRLYSTALELLRLLTPPPPIARWSFDQGEGVTASDMSGNGHVLSLTGASFEEGGWRGGAIGFSGSGMAQVANSSALRLGDNDGDFGLSFAIFVRGNPDRPQTLMAKGTGGVGTPSISLLPTSNRIQFGIATDSGDREATSAFEVPLDEWVHIVYTKQGRMLRLFINGQFDNETSLPGASVGFDAPLFIGNHPQGNGVNALFDEIQIFDGALSSDAAIELAGTSSFPPNPAVVALERRGSLHLQKIRSGLNIAGLELVRSEPAAAELVVSDGGLVPPASTNLRPTIYRYSTLIDRAKQLVTIAQQIESNFFAALEKRDAEAYTLLAAQHDVQLTKETVDLQDIRIQEADSNIALMTLHQDRAQTQFDVYNEWLDAGPNQYEQAMLKNYSDLRDARNSLAAVEALVGTANAMLGAAGANSFNSGVAIAAAGLVGGLLSGQKLSAIERVNDLEAESQTNSFNANLERRKDEWRLQSALAHRDTEIAAQQVFQAGLNKLLVEQERAIASIRVDQAQAVVEFLNNKFTNVELYEWMSDVLSEIYSYFLQQATAMAQLAASQLAFERQQRPPTFIRSDYWQAPNDSASQNQGDDTPDRRGLTGSARLLQDIFQLDQHAFETNQRKLQLVENFSLSRLAPFEFERFRETGVLPFATPMALFDQGFPGHYLRLITSVRVSVAGLIPPTQGIRATLTAAGVSQVVTGREVFRQIEVRRPSETIAFTSPINATGLFELQPEGDLLLPFETMGVDASWELQLPKAANRFNFDSIADVIFTVEYTALHSSDYRHEVVQNLDRTFAAERAYSVRRDFPDLWYHLHQPDAILAEDGDQIHAKIKIGPTQFPPNLEELALDQLVVYFVTAAGESVEVEVTDLLYRDDQSEDSVSFGGATSLDGVISTRRANATSWLPLLGESPIGEWTLVFANTQEFNQLFEADQVQDVLFIIGYSAQTPAWT